MNPHGTIFTRVLCCKLVDVDNLVFLSNLPTIVIVLLTMSLPVYVGFHIVRNIQLLLLLLRRLET